MTLLGGSASG